VSSVGGSVMRKRRPATLGLEQLPNALTGADRASLLGRKLRGVFVRDFEAANFANYRATETSSKSHLDMMRQRGV
jgi:hypothetical protein